jgi:predicted MFS family arabinose efflux permease
MKPRLIVTSLILFATALTFNILFTRISLDKLYKDSLMSQYIVIGKDLQRNLNRGVTYGKPINKFIGMRKLIVHTRNEILAKINEDKTIAGIAVPRLEEDDLSVLVVLPNGDILYSSNNNFTNNNIREIMRQKNKTKTEKQNNYMQVDYIRYADNYVIILPVTYGQNNTIANVTIVINERQINEFLQNVTAKNIIPISTISILGIILLMALLFVSMPREVISYKFSKKRIYFVIILVISTAQVMTSGLLTHAFKNHFIQTNKKNAEKVNQIIKNDIEFLIGNGIRMNKLKGLDGYLNEVISAIPEIQDITLFDHHGQPLYRATKKKVTDFQRSKDAYSEWIEAKKPLLDPDYNTQAYIISQEKNKGFISTNTSKKIIFRKLIDTLLDSGAVIVISILFFVELLILVFKYIERQSDDPLARRVPHFSVMRPAAFLFLFGIDISLSFLPLHMENLYVPIFNLSRDTIMGLPISVEFMFVGISILISGIWLDRRGWHEPFLSGVILAAMGILYSWLAPDAVHFIISRAVVGLGYGLALMAAQGFVITYSDWKSKAQGLAHLFAGIYAGSICGGATGAMLAEWLGYTPVFLFGALILIFVVIYSIVFMRDGMRRPAVSRVKEVKTSYRRRPILDFLTNRTILSLVFLSSLPAAIAVVGFLNYFSPIYLNRIGASQSTIGQIMMIYGICLIYFGPFISRYVDVSRHKKIFIFLGCALGSFALLTFYILEGYAAAITAVVLLGFSSSFVLASQSAYTLELKVTQELGEGKSIGIFRSTSRVGQMLGPIVFSTIMGATNIRSGITYLGLAYLLTAFLFLVLTMKNQKALMFEEFRSEPSI